MKKIIVAALLAVLVACEDRTTYGPCIGAFSDPDPQLVYETNGWNIAMGVIFFEMVVLPIVVIANETKCPVRRRVP
jgi:hypothetical protein